MDIVACTYENIGPFTERSISVFFHHGAYLVKAPIGTGKSFLFFDGPVFALYKYSTRPMLHRNAQRGSICLLFEVEAAYRCIKRTITPTSAGGESVSSQVFSVGCSHEQMTSLFASWKDEVVVSGVDIFMTLKPYLEEVSFGSQRELDATVQTFLPPREALLSINFLMQDSENIFEVPPSQRVIVFKHLFGLVGIDEAKDIISTERKEVQGMIRLLADETEVTSQLQMQIHELKQHKDFFLGYVAEHEDLRTMTQQLLHLPLFRDIGLLTDDLSIDKFSLGKEEHEVIRLFSETIDRLVRHAQRVEWEYEQLTAEKLQREKTIAEIKHEISKIARQKEEIKQQIATVSSSETEELIKCRDELSQTMNSLEAVAAIPHVELFPFSEVREFDAYALYIDEQIMQGKELSHKKELVHEKLKQGLQKKKEYQMQISDLKSRIAQLSEKYDEQTSFRCDKIQDDCPYVEIIKGKSLSVLKEQRVSLETQLSELQKTYVELKLDDVLDELYRESDQIETQAKGLRDFLQKVEWKLLLEKRAQRDQIQKELRQLSDRLAEYEKQREQRDEWKRRITLLEDRMSMLETQMHHEISAGESFILREKELYDRLRSYQKMKLADVATRLEDISKCLEGINTLIQQHIRRQFQRKELKEKERKLKELFTIFSKELLYIALQDFLPQLEQTINSYLHRVVEYEVRFDIPSTFGESIELQISIHDHRGERPVKSLSGGQKALLKIARILSVATIMKSKFLFLDETITSLDSEAIAKVADVIEDFVTFTSMKLYVVTHAQQIQDMSIRKQQIEIK